MWKSLARRRAATSSAGSTPTSATSAPHFVTGLLGPLLDRPRHRVREGLLPAPAPRCSRPAAGASPSSSRGRCSRCCSPQLADFVQPLGGEYAGRRDVLEALPFVEGWGVELGLLVDIVERFGLDATAQVDLGVREHRNRPLDELGAAGDRDPRDRAAARRARRPTAPTRPSSCASPTTSSPQLVDVDGRASARRSSPSPRTARSSGSSCAPPADADVSRPRRVSSGRLRPRLPPRGARRGRRPRRPARPGR